MRGAPFSFRTEILASFITAFHSAPGTAGVNFETACHSSYREWSLHAPCQKTACLSFSSNLLLYAARTCIAAFCVPSDSYSYSPSNASCLALASRTGFVARTCCEVGGAKGALQFGSWFQGQGGPQWLRAKVLRLGTQASEIFASRLSQFPVAEIASSA